MRLYLRFFSMHLKSCMAYRRSFFQSIIGQFLVSCSAFLGVWFLFDRFHAVQGYTISECMLCTGAFNLSFALAEMLFRGFDRMPSVIGNMQFDRILLRPRGLILQMLCQNIDFTRIGKLMQGIFMLVYGIAVSPVVWTLPKAAVLCAMILGGAVLFGAIFIAYAAFCFFTIEGLEWLNAFIDGAREYGSYPFDIYGGAILKFCTFVIPYALVQYYPLSYLLGREVSVLRAFLPLVAPLFAIPCYAFWNFGVHRYKSTGS